MSLTVQSEVRGTTAVAYLAGELDAGSAPQMEQQIQSFREKALEKVVFVMRDVSFLASAGVRVMVFAKQKLGRGTEFVVVGAPPMVLDTFRRTGLLNSFTFVEEYEGV